MTKRQEYNIDHKLAKLINCFLVVSLLITNRYFGILSIDILAVVVWFFATNPIQYLIELLFNHQHKVGKL